MALKPDTLRLTLVLALFTALAPFCTDFYLPSLPGIARALGASTGETQLTLSAFILGLAMGQVLHGPLSDRVGRRPVLLVGLAVFALASAICALASGIEILIGGRFLQALGASAPIVLGRAIVRDLFEGVRAGRELSRMGTILGFVPALGPVLGGLLEAEWGWRAAFWTMCGVGVVLLAVAASALPETLRAYAATPVSIASILRGYRIVWSAPSYRRYACLAALGYAGLFAFISASSFVLQRHYGLSPIAYGLSFGAAALGFSIGTLIGQRVVHSLGLDGTIGLGTAFFLTGGLAMVAATFAGVPSSLAITAPMLLYTIGHGLVLPAAQALSLMPFPDRAGAASSLLGIVQMTLAAGIGIVTGHAISVSPLMLPVIVAAMGASAFALFRAGRGRAVLNGRRGG